MLDCVGYADHAEVIAPTADEGFFVMMQLDLKVGYDRSRIKIHGKISRTIGIDDNFAREWAFEANAEITFALRKAVGDPEFANAGVGVAQYRALVGNPMAIHVIHFTGLFVCIGSHTDGYRNEWKN